MLNSFGAVGTLNMVMGGTLELTSYMPSYATQSSRAVLSVLYPPSNSNYVQPRPASSWQLLFSGEPSSALLYDVSELPFSTNVR